MTEKRRNVLMLRWGLIGFLAFTLFWGTWYFVAGEVPMAALAISITYAMTPAAGIYLTFKIYKADPLGRRFPGALAVVAASSSWMFGALIGGPGFWVAISASLGVMLGGTAFLVVGDSIAGWLDDYPGGFFQSLFRKMTKNKAGSWLTGSNINGI